MTTTRSARRRRATGDGRRAKERCHSERSAAGAQARNRDHPEREAEPSIGSPAIPRLRRFAPPLGMTYEVAPSVAAPPVSRLPSPVSRLPSPVSRLPLAASRLPLLPLQTAFDIV